MNNQRAIELLLIERECISRNVPSSSHGCDRDCGFCDLLQDTDELIDMYTYTIKVLEQVQGKKDIDREWDNENWENYQ